MGEVVVEVEGVYSMLGDMLVHSLVECKVEHTLGEEGEGNMAAVGLQGAASN